VPPDKLERDELSAAMAARRELGPQYEIELAESLVDRVNAVIDSRLAVQTSRRPPLDWAQMALGLGSLALAIPMLAIVAANSDDGRAMIFILAVIAIVNVSYAITRLAHRRHD
jgi:hypothetical protein